MKIIKELLGKIRHFLIILVVLLTVNAVFNLRYDWGGISVIARVYIMVLSFYIIFIFSQINTDEHRCEYTAQYGWIGKYYLFLVLRIFPFVFIYLFTVVFTMINYITTPDWPMEPIYRLLDGRYSNTIAYALILFVILRQKKRPGISIPLFILFSILYYAADKSLSGIFDPGIGSSVIKFLKHSIMIFVLVYGYSKSRWKILGSTLLALFGGAILYTSITSFFILSFFMSPAGSSSLSISGRILLKSGFRFPLKELQKNVIIKGNPQDTKDVIKFLEKYGKDAEYTTSEWEKIILGDRIENNEYIFRYINRRNIKLNFSVLKDYIVSQLLVSPPETIGLDQFSRHFGFYYKENKKEFFNIYQYGNEPLKIVILKSLAYDADREAVHFLIDKLTSIEQLRSVTAYNSLRTITGKNPAADLKKEKYDFDVIVFFRNYAAEMKE
jgi:hypothetical protein